ncbi:MAG: glycosyltransferase family 2 protein [Gammaproteobacteria bacterium]|nr:glycosyltransferase family 2 protein [Gammaproteobacteria bacterium]MBU1722348.1 glycosyltransferase family 2 protein [Gammaproteobacteria bacterium]MBU2004715.1 glycosyltransferase family 2 protein [Gammaproteobacteria bacterium]
MISIILTTYNRPDALNAVLAGLAAQQNDDFEVVIADDGSTSSTTNIIANWQDKLKLRHVWHEDNGFRAAAIRNKAILQSRGNYMIFMDGDCIPRPDFVSQHKALAEQGYFVAGNRVLISQSATTRYLETGEALHTWPFAQYQQAAQQKDLRRSFALRQFPGQFWRKHISQSWKGVRTCNLGVWKQDLLTINGLDESYTGWGHEDADLAVRLLRAGIQRKDGRFATTVLHLWHPENDRSQLKENEQRLTAILSANHTEAKTGLREHQAN